MHYVLSYVFLLRVSVNDVIILSTPCAEMTIIGTAGRFVEQDVFEQYRRDIRIYFIDNFY